MTISTGLINPSGTNVVVTSNFHAVPYGFLAGSETVVGTSRNNGDHLKMLKWAKTYISAVRMLSRIRFHLFWDNEVESGFANKYQYAGDSDHVVLEGASGSGASATTAFRFDGRDS
jgi:hypothetical protein